MFLGEGNDDLELSKSVRRKKEISTSSSLFTKYEAQSAFQPSGRKRKSTEEIETTVKEKKAKTDHQIIFQQRQTEDDASTSDNSKSNETTKSKLDNVDSSISESENSRLDISKCDNTASRIALFMMRDELSKENAPMTIQHSHDFFVISSCKVSAKMRESNQVSEEIKFGNGSYFVPKDIFPADLDKMKRILNEYGVNLRGLSDASSDMAKKTCLKFEKSFDEFIVNIDESLKEDFKLIYNSILETKEMGILASEIKSKLASCENLLFILTKLLDGNLILKVGITKARFVSGVFSSPWTLHSFRMSRTTNREVIPHVKFGSKLIDPESGEEFNRKRSAKDEENMQVNGYNTVKSRIYEYVSRFYVELGADQFCFDFTL